ncbi:MAG: nucleotidyltransferase family protein [Actinomycetota bacterium]|nr:nucleotidyltransferase family protein [Actinomycetota bacterium]
MEDGSFALMPLLYRRLESWQVDEPLIPRLRGLYRHSWYRGNVLLERLKEVNALAAELQIDLLIADEPLLIERVYRDPGLRPATRLDLLIRPESADVLIRGLEQHGWHRASPHSLWLQHPSGPFAVLQHRILPKYAALGVDATTNHWLNSTDQLLRTCVGEVRQSTVGRLQWIADAKLQIAAEPAEIDWERLLQTTTSCHLGLHLRDALSYLSRTVAASVPGDVLARLEERRPGPQEQLAHGLSRVDGAAIAHRVLPAAARRALRRLSSLR